MSLSPPAPGISVNPGERACSFDGDADRIVYFYTGSEGDFHLLDGDKIAILISTYLKQLLTQVAHWGRTKANTQNSAGGWRAQCCFSPRWTCS